MILSGRIRKLHPVLSAQQKRYDHLSRDELAALLQARDRRDATRFGLVWEANEIDRDKAVNADFVALDLLAEHQIYARVLLLFRDGGTRWMTVGYDDKTKKPCLTREFRLSDAAGF